MVIRHVSRASRHLLFWSLITAALVLSAFRIWLTDIADYKPELERRIREAAGIAVHIGRLDANMRGFSPELKLIDIAVDSADSAARPAIRLREIRIGIDLLAWLFSQDPMASGWVSLVGAKLDIIRNSDGSLAVKGLPSSDEQPLWLLQGGKYEILQSQLTWQDLKRGSPKVAVDDFDLLIKNTADGANHEVHLLAKLPESHGDRLRVSARLTGNPFQPDTIDGSLYLEADNLQGPAWLNDAFPEGPRLNSGSGDFRIWSEWRHALPYRIAGYAQAQQIELSRPQGAALQLDTLEGNFVWRDEAGSQRWCGYDVNLVAKHQRWPNAEFCVGRNADGALSGLIERIDLQALMHLAAAWTPADDRQAQWLKINPHGILRQVGFYADANFDRYALHGDFTELGSEAADVFPQLQSVNGTFSIADAGGHLRLNGREVLLNAPALFRNPLTLHNLDGSLSWRQTADAWQIHGADLMIDSDMRTASAFDLLVPKNGDSPMLAMRTRFSDFNDIGKVPLYLPAKVMSQDAVAWLDDAFVAGRIERGEMVLSGRLADFPFEQGNGRFETVFAIDGGEIQINEDWPHLQDVHADVQFLGADLQVAIDGGHSEQVDISQAVVAIPDLANSEAVYVWGRVGGKLAAGLSYLQKTPLHGKVDPLVKAFSAEGEVRVDLDLKIPYYENQPTVSEVAAHLTQAKLTLNSVALAISDINGVLHFSEDGASGERLDARALGHPIRGTLSHDQSSTRLVLDGTTGTAELQKQFTFLKNQSAAGTFRYRTDLLIPYAAERPSVLTITSDLQGVAVNGPDWLAKSAEQSLPIALTFRLDSGDRLPLDIRYGQDLSLALTIDTKQNRLYSGHVVYGGSQAEPYPAAGLKLDIDRPTFKLSEALAAFGDSEQQQRLPPLREVGLTTEQLVWQGRDIGPFHCSLTRRDQGWQGSIDSKFARGQLNIPDLRGGGERFVLNMDYLNLSAADQLDFDAAEDVVTELPLIEIDSQQLLWRGVDLGKLKLRSERRPQGMHFKQIQLNKGGRTMEFRADWTKLAGASVTQLSGRLTTDGFGQFLTELGYTDEIKETHADISINGGWSGAPHQFSLAGFDGTVQIDLSDGRISSIEPGFGRLLGLIAMEQWAKRLSLDFSDVYRQGFAFDRITGHFRFSNAQAYTDDLVIDGVAAKLSLAGTADLAKKTVDHRVAVIPKSSDALPIAGTIVGGIAAMITQVVTDDYKEGYFFGSQYKLAGPWGNVEVTPLHDQDGLVKKAWRSLTGFEWLNDLTK
ncbi:TIGR02099 family protein [Methylomonas koyamae]|uniref:TIGR02099 family protein n=1 Tax=Methylomonas koyamae TaxID=702114 RepID=A0A177NL46_9GAMM|nr:TIGR02099 family protein [Methylomonas koyamae]